ncbi:hypothetical protein QYF36_003041 [Acer negundo]|nr:hypothetical protein QYF36_003041 [Acer negundo]
MTNPIPENWKKLWDKWNIRGVILFSLSLQTLLILMAPLRKGTANKLIILLIWSAYLLADWAANFAVGLISNSQGDHLRDHDHLREDSDLLAFWAPFLLLLWVVLTLSLPLLSKTTNSGLGTCSVSASKLLLLSMSSFNHFPKTVSQSQLDSCFLLVL